ncbi:hypothetical protein IAQ61_008222 [Plenodomus lingam]|uniref:uncharacterized protein n=1 Tax=Leptosphaeria maculans TaxID=5022 RepID=UPI00332E4E2F|nr:hypothetical protein IAQ61_008222 [Plenodomus lingam]
MSAASLELGRWNQSEVVLLDIEGTIASISFVKNVMPQYPYALDSLTRLARESWSDANFQTLIDGFPDATKRDASTLIAHVQDLTQRDVKAVYLKHLQGRLPNFSTTSPQARWHPSPVSQQIMGLRFGITFVNKRQHRPLLH